MINTMQS